MKKIIYILLICVVLVVTGCNAQIPASNNSTSQPQNSNAPLSNDNQTASSEVTIIIPCFYENSYDSTLSDESVLYLEELFATNGFDVKIDSVYYNIESPTCYDEYFTYLSQNLYNDNTLAFVSGYKIDILSSYVTLADLNKEIEATAPAYYAYTQRNAIITNSNDSYIITSLSGLDNVTAVLVLNTIKSEYNKPIETSEDYLSFINWAQKRNESLRPSVILTFHDDITARSNILYDLFLPQQGYIPLGSYLGRTYSLCVDAKKPNKVYDMSTLSFYDSMLENIEIMANYSKIAVKHENSARKNFSEYSSVVMPVADISFYSGISDYNFYPANYTMEILNAETFMERTYENTYLAAAQNTNQSEALRLLNWIHEDINNYIAVKYGESGIDYSINEYGHLVLSEAGQIFADNNPVTDMINNIEFEASFSNVPSNYLSEINTIKYVKNDVLDNMYENYQTLITTNDYIFDATNRFNRRWEVSVRALELTTERKVNFEGGTLVFNNIDDLISEITK